MDSPDTKVPSIQIKRLYIKELTCKVPHAPSLFSKIEATKENLQPNFAIEMHIKHQALSQEEHEVVMHSIVTAKLPENLTAFTMDIQQAGIFKLEGLTQEQVAQALKIQCPMHLYPYLCRALADTSMQLGFSPLLLSPLQLVSSGDLPQPSAKVQTPVGASTLTTSYNT